MGNRDNLYWKKAAYASLITSIATVSLTACGTAAPSVAPSSLRSSSASSGSEDSNALRDYDVDKKAGSFLTSDIDSAKIFVTEFTDFQCSACAGMQPTIKKLVDKYRGTDVAVVVRNFPLPSHSHAKIAAQAAQAAKIQGKYEEYTSQLYETQKGWSGLDAGAVTAKFTSIAKSLKLDLNKFNTDMNSSATKDLVSKDITAGSNADVGGTPTIFVGPKRVVVPDGARYVDVQRQIEDMVAEGQSS